MKVLSLVGARPQFIKEAVLNHAFQNQGIDEIIVNSGQHYDINMSDVFFSALNIKKPDYNLNVGSGTHAAMTGKIMIEFEKVLEKINPDLVLVYGDTNTTLAGALTAAKLHVPVAHVEAGIRMLPRSMPEEINRVLTDRISSLLFCPSHLAVENLAGEGIRNGVHFCGDVMYDLFLQMKDSFLYDQFDKLKLEEGKYIVMTLHRDYNVDVREMLEKILVSAQKISQKIKIVFPLHPRTLKNIKHFGIEGYLDGITITEPLDYLNLIGLIKNSWKVITDSGGLQKESYFAGKQAVVVMPDSGWKELVDAGINVLANGDNLYEKIFNDDIVFFKEGIYGDGKAGEKIVSIIKTV